MHILCLEMLWSFSRSACGKCQSRKGTAWNVAVDEVVKKRRRYVLRSDECESLEREIIGKIKEY